MTTTTDTNEVSLTPRTDAAEMPLDRVDIIASLPAYIVHADFARELERELSEATDDLMRTQIEMQLEIDRAEAEVERLKKVKSYWANLWADLSRASVNDIVRLGKRAEKAEAEVERLGKLLFETRSLLTEFFDCVDIGGLHDGDCNISTEDPEKWEQGCNCTTADLRRKYIKLYSK